MKIFSYYIFLVLTSWDVQDLIHPTHGTARFEWNFKCELSCVEAYPLVKKAANVFL